MAYRIFARWQTFLDNTGKPNAGGVVRFYDPGTLNPKNAFGDAAASINIGSTETLDAAGRLVTGVFGVGSYRVVVETAAGVTVSDDDPISDPAGAGLTIPPLAGNAGELLTTDGAVLQWLKTLLVPDVTGQAGKVLGNDGLGLLWQTAQASGIPTTTNTGGTRNITIGPFLIQFGTDTFPAPSGGTPLHGAAKVVTFPVAFASVVAAFVTGNKNTVATHDYKPVLSCEYTTANLTANYNINEESTAPIAEIYVAVPFSWLVIGLKA